MVLPNCVSSRPHASESFRIQADIRVDILGFTEIEREHFIKQALPDQPHKVKELTQYLYQQPSVDSMCFVPFNMVILLYLYKLGIAPPKNSTELYNRFICFTICQHLYKVDNPLAHDITDLTQLPEACSTIIQQLSKFSLDSLNNNQFVFTLDEITKACPAISGDINGFGLLQAVQHFGLYVKTMTLNFIHFTIQEFLAAHYISHLPPNEVLKEIEANFWNNSHINMFSIYMSLTKGQQSSFKKFLSSGNETTPIADEFLNDQLKCLYLYRHFHEADDRGMCVAIEQAKIFESKEIMIKDKTLAASDMELISLFLTLSSNKNWVKLDLYNCHIQDKELNILYRGLRHSNNVTIDNLWFSNNSLTTNSSSVISELTVKCKVKVLGIDNNDGIGRNQQLYCMLTDPSSVLEQLYMSNTALSSRSAIALFNAIKNNNKLKDLNISRNSIMDDACDAITTALEKNCCLVSLTISDNLLRYETLRKILQCLKVNNTLKLINLGFQSDKEYIRSLQEVVNKERESQGCKVKLEIWFFD